MVGRAVRGVAVAAWAALAGCTSGDGGSDTGPVEWAEVWEINGAALAIRARGAAETLPVLLVIHGGPGFAMLDLFHTTLPALEGDFIVLTYDQRGAGLSLAPGLDPADLTLARFVEDAHAVAEQALALLGRAGDRDVYVLGHSMGTVIGLDLVAAHPEAYAAFIGVGQVVDVAENEQGSYDFALSEARADENEEAIDALLCVGRPTEAFEYPGSDDPACDADVDPYEVTSEWMSHYGGEVQGAAGAEDIEAEILSSPAYAGHEVQWAAGVEFSAHLFDDPAVLEWDARSLHGDDTVPLFFFQGRHDYDTPAPLVADYSAGVRGPHRLVWFEHSAHFPFWEEPESFRERLQAVVRGQPRADAGE